MRRTARHLRRGGDEINLTPLLDVLFSILFIVMLTAVRNEAKAEEEAAQELSEVRSEAEAALDKAKAQADELRTELDERDTLISLYENRIESFDMYRQDAVVITVSNYAENGAHWLVISDDSSLGIENSIRMGIQLVENTSSRVEAAIAGAVETAAGRPVYVVFHCDQYAIYTIEYEAVDKVLEQLQKTNKEVFYKSVMK